jgi:hypothetical protein
MRTFIFALAAIVPAFAIDRAGAVDEPPAFDIARNCNEETSGYYHRAQVLHERRNRCQEQLTKSWSSYSASQKKECVGESSIGGEKSYVELLTCLEMAKEVGRQ